MRASIAVFYIAALATPAVLRAQAPGDPDALYRERAVVAKAREAASIWNARLTKTPTDFESAWKLARAEYWLGGHGDRSRAARRPRARRRGGPPGEHAGAHAARGLLLDGRLHGRSSPSRSACDRG